MAHHSPPIFVRFHSAHDGAELVINLSQVGYFRAAGGAGDETAGTWVGLPSGPEMVSEPIGKVIETLQEIEGLRG